MSSIRYAAVVGAVALLSKVNAHGIVSGIVANGEWQSGYDPSFMYSRTPPVVAGWSIPEDQDRGFVSDYTSPDIICHKGATPGGAYVNVAAGDSIELQWTVWPESHHGPVIDYLASCGDDCSTVDKTQLLFNKIDEAGLNNGDPAPGNWASDDLIANNNTWTVTIPASIAPGKYVLRHEIIALHSAFDVGGAQNYPQCINIEVSGSGTNSLASGTKGTELYTAEDPGIHLSIYYPVLTSYTIPGPPLMDGSSSGSPPASSAASSSSATSSTSVAAAQSSSSSTTTSASVEITASPTKPAAVISTSTSAEATTTIKTKSTTTTTVTVTPSIPEETDCSSESSAPTQPPADQGPAPGMPSASQVAPTGISQPPSMPSPPSGPPSAPSPADTTTPAVSFTSTVTGRIGKPTRFVCYIDDDEFQLTPA
jgi:lytic cellulose monooxygenase (C1-hydroxylating)